MIFGNADVLFLVVGYPIRGGFNPMVKHRNTALKSAKAKKPIMAKKHIRTRTENHRTKAKEKVVELDRRMMIQDRRSGIERRQKNDSVAAERRVCERRAKVNRRRQIDPTTCERDYSRDEIEFMNAMEEYKRASGRMFPTCSEVLEVLRKLGYEKRTAAFAPYADESPLVPDISPPLATF
jgi:hypothetical protein